MEYREEVESILDSVNGNVSKAAIKVLNSEDSGLILYVIEQGLLVMRREKNHKTRRALRETVIKPEFVKGKVTGSIVRNKRSLERLNRVTMSLFDTYLIAGTRLGDMTKEGLETAAAHLRSSAKGQLRDAVWWEAIAKPMNSTEVVRQRWKDQKAVALIREELWSETEEKAIEFAAA